MLAPDLRIHNKRLLDKIITKGRVYRTPLGLIKYIGSDKPCFAVVISKKQLKLATDRNRVKRRMKALIIKKIAITPPVAAVVYINPKINSLSWQTILKKWQESLENWSRN